MPELGPVTPNMLEAPKTKADAVRIIENLRMFIYQSNPCSVTVEGIAKESPELLGFGAAPNTELKGCEVRVRTCEKTFIFRSSDCSVELND